MGEVDTNMVDVSRIPTELVERAAKAIYAQAQATYAKAAPGWDKAGQHVKMAMIGDAQAALAVVWPAIEALKVYADPRSAKDEHGKPIDVPDFYSELSFGDRAAEALASLGLDLTT